jgi:hypothetical protein
MKNPTCQLRKAGQWLAGLSSYFTPDFILDVILLLWGQITVFLLITVLMGAHHV